MNVFYLSTFIGFHVYFKYFSLSKSLDKYFFFRKLIVDVKLFVYVL